MIAFGDVAILRPWWLAALPLLALIVLLTKPRNGALVGWRRAADGPLLRAMIARGGASGGGRLWSPMIVAAVLGILALSGPAVRGAAPERLRNLDATIIVVDLSQEIASASRLRAAASAAHDILDHSPARQVGLILYAGDAYLAAPLTDDPDAIDPLLFALDEKTVPDPGARPDRALALARSVLGEAHIIEGDVVIVSGGGGLETDAARREATALRGAGYRVDTLFVPDPDGSRALQADRAAGLAALAGAGGGIAGDVFGFASVLDRLSGQTIRHIGASAIAALGWRDLGRLLLIGAAIPLLLGFRRTTR